jgi:hypothetical protein
MLAILSIVIEHNSPIGVTICASTRGTRAVRLACRVWRIQPSHHAELEAVTGPAQARRPAVRVERNATDAECRFRCFRARRLGRGPGVVRTWLGLFPRNRLGE